MTMIIEIIVLLGFLGSLAGFIFFIRHYFKSWKAKSDNKQMLLAIESAEDENACYDRFYNNILRDIDWSRVFIIIFVIGLAILIFWTFAAPNTESSNGNKGVPIIPTTNVTQNINTTSLNQTTIPQALSFNGAIPWWLIPGAVIIFTWIMFRHLRRSTVCW